MKRRLWTFLENHQNEILSGVPCTVHQSGTNKIRKEYVYFRDSQSQIITLVRLIIINLQLLCDLIQIFDKFSAVNARKKFEKVRKHVY